jgi:hypothetical protein
MLRKRLVVLCRMAVEDDGHQSAEVLDDDDLIMKRSGEGLCMGDDDRTLGLARAFCLCISRSSLVTCYASVSAMASRWWRRQVDFLAEGRPSQEGLRLISHRWFLFGPFFLENGLKSSLYKAYTAIESLQRGDSRLDRSNKRNRGARTSKN